jgi:hypothetical protein
MQTSPRKEKPTGKKKLTQREAEMLMNIDYETKLIALKFGVSVYYLDELESKTFKKS